jgi:hypothetical protein
MKNQKSFEIAGSIEPDELDYIDNIYEIDYWINDIESDIRNFFDENESTIEDLKQKIKSIPKKLYKKSFEKYNFNEHKIMLEVAQALQERALIDREYIDFQKWYKCVNLLKLVITKEEIDFNNDIIKQYATIFEKIYLLGYFHGTKEGLEIDSLFYEEIYENYYYKKKSSDAVKKSRWAERNELYEQAVAYAKISWEDGDELMHHEMIREIFKVKTFKKLNRDTLKKRLKPIAEGFGKFYNPNEKSEK